MIANVPNSAASAYKSKALLHFATEQLNGGAISVTGDDAVERIAEGDGKNSGGFGAVDDRRIGDGPGLSAVGGVEDAGDFASGGEPEVGVGG